MVTVSLLSSFSVNPLDGMVQVACDGSWFQIHPNDVPALLCGTVVGRVNGTLGGTVCLSGSRLVLTTGDACAIYLFPPSLIGEFVSLLDAVEVLPSHAPGGG